MNFRRSIVMLVLIFDILLFSVLWYGYRDQVVGRFHIIDPNSLYIVFSRKNHKDTMIFTYADTTIALGYRLQVASTLAAQFDLKGIDYYVDYTMDETIDEDINTFDLKAYNGAYIITLDNFVYAFAHHASESVFQFITSKVSSMDILKINCMDESLFTSPLFSKKIMNLLMDQCTLSDRLLESLYEKMIDIFVIEEGKTIIIKYKNRNLSIMEWAL